jgi:hypothetical protein
MDNNGLKRSMEGLAQATGRREAVRALGGRGLAVLAALGLAEASAKGSRKGGAQADGKGKKKRKSKRGPAGPAGPAGLAEFKTRKVNSALSDPLATAAGSRVSATAECGGVGKVVSCGYVTDGGAAAFVNVFVETMVSNNEGSCFANLLRTSEAGSIAGAAIKAVAICLD